MTTAHQATKKAGRVLTTLLAAILMLGTARPAPASICRDCEPSDPPPPPRAPSTSVPDFAFQLTPCLGPEDLADITASLTVGLVSAEKQLDVSQNDPPPKPDVRAACVDGVTTIAAWLFPMGYLGAWDDAAARDLGFSQIDVRQGKEEFGFRVTRDAIDLLIDIAWRDMPRTMNDNGQEDPNGAIHLDDFEIRYYDSVYNIPGVEFVDTRVNGHYDGPFAQIDFFAGVGDYLALAKVDVDGKTVGRILCTSEPEFGMDTTLETILATVFGILHNMDAMVDSFTTDGPACQIASMLPLQTLLGGPSKLLFDYQRLNVGDDGILAGGVFQFALTAPVVEIHGPSPLVAEVGQPAPATYWLEITDMKPPFKVTWTGNGEVVTNGSTWRTYTWDLGTAKPVSYLHRAIGVKVIDGDGVEQTATRTFGIKVVYDPSQPPICALHPVLPECQQVP